jgi:hypothetical protein
MGTEAAFKPRFVWVDEKEKKLCWSKGTSKEAAFKSVELNSAVQITKPEFNAAKAATMFAAAEADGFVVTVTAPGQPSVDLKIEGGVQDANAWHIAMQTLCNKR